MEEKENKGTDPTWKEAENWIGALVKAHDTIASETIRDLEKRSKSKDLALWLIVLSFSGVIAGLIASNIAHTKRFYQNDSEWRKTVQETNNKWIDYLQQYDFITQDGEGINYYNSDVGGNVNNGATDQKAEKQE